MVALYSKTLTYPKLFSKFRNVGQLGGSQYFTIISKATSNTVLHMFISPWSTLYLYPPCCLPQEADLCKNQSLGFYPLWLPVGLASGEGTSKESDHGKRKGQEYSPTSLPEALLIGYSLEHKTLTLNIRP